MIGIHVVSHGKLCQGIIHSLQMIIGETAKIGFTQLEECSDVDTFRHEMLDKSQQLETGQGVLVFVDMFGATPYNCALFNSKEFDAAHYQIIAGFNLPLLIEAVIQREHNTLLHLVAQLQLTATETIVFQEQEVSQ